MKKRSEENADDYVYIEVDEDDEEYEYEDESTTDVPANKPNVLKKAMIAILSDDKKIVAFSGAIFLIVAITIGLLLSGTGSVVSSGRTCKACHRSFTDSANVRSIINTNMCKNCYGNYSWAQSALGK